MTEADSTEADSPDAQGPPPPIGLEAGGVPAHGGQSAGTPPASSPIGGAAPARPASPPLSLHRPPIGSVGLALQGSTARQPTMRSSSGLQLGADEEAPRGPVTVCRLVGERHPRRLAELRRHEHPLPTSLELYRELKAAAPDSLHYLLADLFERNTYWDLTAETPTAERVEGGRWRVSLEVSARKVAVDTVGVETNLPMNDLVEVGLFAAAEDAERSASRSTSACPHPLR